MSCIKIYYLFRIPKFIKNFPKKFSNDSKVFSTFFLNFWNSFKNFVQNFIQLTVQYFKKYCLKFSNCKQASISFNVSPTFHKNVLSFISDFFQMLPKFSGSLEGCWYSQYTVYFFCGINKT